MAFPGKQDYDRLDVGTPLSEETTCDAFPRLLRDQAQKAAESGDQAGRAIFSLLEDVCSFGLRTDDRREPFGPRVQFTDGRRSVSIDDLSEDQVSFLESIAEVLTIPDLRARVADVVFTRKKHHRLAAIALNAYLASGDSLLSSDDWVQATQRFMRALSLTGYLRDERDRVVSHLAQILESRRPDTSFFTARVLESLLDHRCGDPAQLTTLADAAADGARLEENWDRTEEYLLLASRFYLKARDQEMNHRRRREAAECHVRFAEACGDSQLAAVRLERAIQLLRTIPETQTRVQELHRKLLAEAKTAVANFREMSFPLNFSEPAKMARSQVTGRPLQEAIFRLATIHQPFSAKALSDPVIEEARSNPFIGMMPRTKVNRLGRVVATRGSLMANTAEEQDKNLRLAMFEKAAEYRQAVAAAVINPARSLIQEEHYPGTRELGRIVAASGFVPPGREELFARGLTAGFDGDFIVASHLLMPQVEHAIRTVLAAQGALTSKLDDEGIQDERDLGALLYMPEAKTVFGDDLLFELQGLLIERCGSNLRNELAHGLLEPQDCLSQPSIYFWWLTLHMVVMPLIPLTAVPAESGTDIARESQG